ncbi:MAG: hypothetical protein HY720_25570 [Planctomycetes bacterium]|nr:hypothetical protein [Planctomycetota bacterium]
MNRNLELLRQGEILIGAAREDAELRGYLEERRISVEQILEGLPLLEEASAALRELGALETRSEELAREVKREYVELRAVVNAFRRTAFHAVEGRWDLVTRLRVRKPRGTTGPTPPVPPAVLAGPATEEQTGGSDNGNGEANGNGCRRYGPALLMKFLGRSRPIVVTALTDLEILAALERVGCTRQDLDQLQAQLIVLSTRAREEIAATREAEEAACLFRDHAGRFRVWLRPWKRRLKNALAGRQDLKARLALA